jgi:hypothetical protein
LKPTMMSWKRSSHFSREPPETSKSGNNSKPERESPSPPNVSC